MLHQNQKISENVGIACSGGVDSMVVLNFLMNTPKRNLNNLHVFHVDHGTEHGKIAKEFVQDFCGKHSLNLSLHTISKSKPKNESWEEFWRNERYGFLKSFSVDIITAHHLNDCVETWVMSSLRGCGKLIRKRNGNIIRPFLETPKKEFENWAERKNVEFVQDESNFENIHERNIVRNEMMKSILKVNPGIEKTIRKLLKNEK